MDSQIQGKTLLFGGFGEGFRGILGLFPAILRYITGILRYFPGILRYFTLYYAILP